MTHHELPELPEVLQGARVDLVLASVAQLRSRVLPGEPIPWGHGASAELLGHGDPLIGVRALQVQRDPSSHPWLLRLAVDRATDTVVGYANFHGPPDADGTVEIGYEVLPEHRGRGFGTEIARTMWRAAAGHPDVRRLRASVAPGNAASLAIVRGAGLVEVGEQWDPEDGRELVFEVAATDAMLD